MLDAVRGYLQLASGLTEVTLNKAREVAQSLLSGDLAAVVSERDSATDAARTVGAQVQDLADDIVNQATANRELLIGLIRTEIDRAAGRLGFVREEELAALRRQVQRLEEQVHARAGAAAPARPAAPRKAPVKKKAAPAAPSAAKKAAKKVPATKRAPGVPGPTTPERGSRPEPREP